MAKKPVDKKKLHHKPTSDELDKNIEKAVEELDKPEGKPASPDDKPDKKPEKKVAPKPDYKKKFLESSREALVLHSKNKQINEALDEAAKLKPPTDEEMKAQLPEWDDMGDFEKKLARNDVLNERRFKTIRVATKVYKDVEKWQKNVEKFTEDPETLVNNPKLEGRVDEFKIFASKPTRRGMEFNDLISAFLYTSDDTPTTKSKGGMFETGSGGPSEPAKPKSGKISIEEARTLRQTDYGKWKEYLKAGKIETA